MKKIVVTILILSAIILGGVVLSGDVFGEGGNEAVSILSLIKGQKLQKAELKIEGMWCASCAVGAEYSLQEIDGVKDALIELTDDLEGGGWVVYEKGKVNEEQIIKAIEPYEATIMSDTVYTGEEVNK